MTDPASSLAQWMLANALVASVLALFAWLARRAGQPQLVHALCVLAFAKLLTPPLWTFALPAPAAPAAPNELLADLGAADLLALAETALPVEPGMSLATIAVVASLAGTLALLALAAWRARRFRRLLRLAEPAPSALRARAAVLAARLGLARCPDLVLVPARISPMVCLLGGRTRLLMPRDLLATLAGGGLDALLVHELAHAARRDHWVRVLELLASAAYWWLPTTWWLRRVLHAAEERCCDARVLAVLAGEPRAYADALLSTVDFLAGSPRAMPPIACGASAFSDLKQRLTTIMTQPHDRPISRLARTGLLALAAAALPIAPSFAQEGEQADEAARAELRSAAREVARLRAEIEAIRAEIGAVREHGKRAHAAHEDAARVYKAEEAVRVRAAPRGEVLHVDDLGARIDADVKAKVAEALKKARVQGVDASELHEHIQKVVREATRNVDVDRDALKEALAEVHEHAGAEVKKAHEALAKALEHAHAHGDEAVAQAKKAYAYGMEKHAKAQADKAANKAKASDEKRAGEEQRAATVQKLRRRAASADDDSHDGDDAKEARATRDRRAADRAAEIREIEQEMRKLQRKLEELRRQGDSGGD